MIAFRTMEGEPFSLDTRLSPHRVELTINSPVREEFIGEFVLSNSVGGDISNLTLHAGCKCTIITPPPKHLANGRSARIDVKIRNTNTDKQLVLVDYEVQIENAITPVTEIVELILVRALDENKE